jgi:glyoxylase-like metal-dependent hydrolase (beta-lactamase superfamily II)
MLPKGPEAVVRTPVDLDLGDLRVRSLDGGVLGFTAKVADREIVIWLAARPALIEGPGFSVLVDAGFGPADPLRRSKFRLQDPLPLQEQLAAMGLPDGPDMLLLTHLHFDHAGGTLEAVGEGEETLRFPQAELAVHRAEWDAALIDGRGSNLAERIRSTLPGREPRFLDVTTEHAEQPYPGIQLEQVQGHTEGLLVIHAVGKHSRCLIPTDLVPTRRFLVPRLDKIADQDPALALESRQRVLHTAAARGDHILFYHDPAVPSAKLESTGTSVRLLGS